MSVLGIDTMPEAPSSKKSRWIVWTVVCLGVMIAFFVWVDFSTIYLLFMGKPLIQH
jgi:hypothetical protein